MGAGISNSCASYHGQPVRLSWQWWRRCCPESRDAPHLFGPGLKERLAYEIAGDLRTARSFVLAKAKMIGSSGQRDRYSARKLCSDRFSESLRDDSTPSTSLIPELVSLFPLTNNIESGPRPSRGSQFPPVRSRQYQPHRTVPPQSRVRTLGGPAHFRGAPRARFRRACSQVLSRYRLYLRY